MDDARRVWKPWLKPWGKCHTESMRVALRFLFSALGLAVASYVLPGIRHDAFVDLLAVAVILGLCQATLGRFLKVVAFVPVACSLGCFGLFINGLIFYLAGTLSAHLGLGFHVKGFWAGFFGALISSVIAYVLEMVFLGSEKKESRSFREEPRRIKIIN